MGLRFTDPERLPRQRQGTTPQMHGRYPDYDVLDNAGHWDEVTRKTVLDRVQNIPPIRFFSAAQAATAGALCDLLTAQDREPRIPVLNYVDEKLHTGSRDGYQYFDMPDDSDAWRMILQGLDEQAAARGQAPSFAEASDELRHQIVSDFAEGKLYCGVWERLNVAHAFSVAMRYVLQAFYSHPWAWNEIGWGGPAYPRGYSRFGSPHLQGAEREPWEGREAYDVDPVSGTPEPPP
jgi:Gluconate 2-dehydrogenase subunit 3